MASSVKLLTIFLYFFGNYLVSGSLPHKKFEYKLSFKGPHLVQRDGTIPFWEHGGHAIASDESIRITPSLRSKKGHVWSKNKNTNAHWEVEVTFRVSGRGRIGADGLAFWYTEQRMSEGPVFGSSDNWNGLAVFFDSFDNDAQHNNPYIMAMVNDGTVNYDHNTDGAQQQLGGCLRDFRNKPFPVRAKIEYYKNALTVWFHNGMSQNKEQYELCMRADNINLPPTGHFGISGATGGLADDHDVQSFLTHSLTPPAEGASTDTPVSAEEKQKFEKEFDQYWDKLQKAKDDYKKQNPEKATQFEDDEEEWFQSQDQKELMNIFEGQNMIAQTIKDLNRKMDEIIGRQEQTLSQLGAVARGGGATGGQQTGGGQVQYVDNIKRHEVDSLINNQRDLIQSIRDIKSVVNGIHSQGGGGGGNVGSADMSARHQQIQDSLRGITADVQSLVSKQNQPPPVCPQVAASNCVTPFYFMTFIALQIALVVGYAVYRSNKEAASKKFY